MDHLMENSIYIAYEDLLIGRIRFFNTFYFFGVQSGALRGANERIAFELVRYAIEKILKWTPEKARMEFDSYIISALKLDKIIEMIEFPIDVEKGNTLYILSKLYPKQLNFSMRTMTEKTYQGVLENGNNFVKDYFNGSEGFYRYCCCLRYLVENYMIFYRIEDVYDFICSKKGLQFLDKYRLRVPAEQFGINLVDAVFEISKDNENSELFYHYYSHRLFLKDLSEEKIIF